MLPWRWVLEIVYFSPSEARVRVAPAAVHIASLERTAKVLKPVPWPTAPTTSRPQPSWSCTVFSATPGTAHTPMRMVREPTLRSAIMALGLLSVSAVCIRPSFAAVFGLTYAGLSHTTLLRGSGNSQIQELLA